MIGQVEAADGDRNDKLELSLRGQYAGLFEIDAEGKIYMRPEQLQNVNDSTIHLVAIAVDSGVPPRSTSVPVTVTMEGLALAQSAWSSSLLGMFVMIVAIFMMIILALTCYIVRSKQKKRKTSPSLGRNRVHSHAHSTVSSANLVTHEKLAGNGKPVGATVKSGGVSVLHMKHGGNITMSNPMSNGHHHHHHHSHQNGVNGNASSLLAASLERERERQRERENYAATVRSKSCDEISFFQLNINSISSRYCFSCLGQWSAL